MSLATLDRPVAAPIADTPHLSTPSARLAAAMMQLVSRHGRWRVLRALLLTPDHRSRRLGALDLPAHLQRDLGLTPDQPINPLARSGLF